MSSDEGQVTDCRTFRLTRIFNLIGYIPQMVIFALMGKGVVVLSEWKIGLSVVLFIISSVLSVWLYREYQAVQLLGHGQAEDSSLAAETGSQ